MDRIERKKQKFTARTLKAYLMAAKERKAKPKPTQDLSALTVSSLKVLAHTHGVVIHAGARKADIIAAIEHAGRYMRRDMRSAE